MAIGVTTKVTEEENAGLEKFSKAALMYGKMGAKEQILSSLLIRANGAGDGVKKVMLICESAMLTELSEEKKDKIDLQSIQDLYIVADSFANVLETDKWYRIIPWSFPQTQENFEKLIKPWHMIMLRFDTLRTRLGRKMYVPYYNPFESADSIAAKRREASKNVREELDKMPRHEAYFDITNSGALLQSSFLALKSEFVQWALKLLMPVQLVVAETISPHAYQNVFATMYAKEWEKEPTEGEGEEQK